MTSAIFDFEAIGNRLAQLRGEAPTGALYERDEGGGKYKAHNPRLPAMAVHTYNICTDACAICHEPWESLYQDARAGRPVPCHARTQAAPWDIEYGRPRNWRIAQHLAFEDRRKPPVVPMKKCAELAQRMESRHWREGEPRKITGFVEVTDAELAEFANRRTAALAQSMREDTERRAADQMARYTRTLKLSAEETRLIDEANRRVHPVVVTSGQLSAQALERVEDDGGAELNPDSIEVVEIDLDRRGGPMAEAFRQLHDAATMASKPGAFRLGVLHSVDVAAPGHDTWSVKLEDGTIMQHVVPVGGSGK